MYVFDMERVVFDETILSEEEKEFAVKVEIIPQPEARYGFTPRLRADHVNKVLYYDYVPVTGIDQIVQKAQDDIMLELIEGGLL